MKKFIFIDFDGVLNSDNNFQCLCKAGKPTMDEFGTVFDSVCVRNFRTIIDATGAKIVVTSSWRYLLGFEGLCEMWKKRNLPGKVYSTTPMAMLLEQNESNVRGMEIDNWLEKGKYNEDNCRYVILDDVDEFTASQQSHLINVNPLTGLTEQDVEKAIELLNA